MSKKLTSIALFISSLSLNAGTVGDLTVYNPWFVSIGTGYSWTLKPGIVNPDPNFWDFSQQGYDGDLGERGFYSFAIGKQVCELLDISVSYLNNEAFNYQKFQTGLSGTPGFTGSDRTRYFELQNKSLLLNGFLHPAAAWAATSMLEVKPFIGAGIGWGHNQVRHFHTVGNSLVAGVPIGSTTSIGDETTKNSFAWQGSAGLSIRPTQSHLSANFGYRYFSGGEFRGPKTIYTNSEGFLTAKPWSGDLKANQVFVEFVYTV